MKIQNESIVPIVLNRPPLLERPRNSLLNMFSSMWSPSSIPKKWMSYVSDTNTSRTPKGNFVVAERLRKFLSPYRAELINDVDQFSFIKLTLFFSFFAQLEDKNLTEEVKELHLSKVVVLLQLLADPNSSNSPLSFPNNFLWSTFDSEQSGLDILNLLFSYGLDYKKFLLNLAAFKRHVYAPVSSILPENEYSNTYHLLSSAYSHYKTSQYKEAADCYREASKLLHTLASQEKLSKTIRDDYLWRHEKSMEYYNQCCSLLETKTNRLDTTEPYSTWEGLWNTGRGAKTSDNLQLLDKKTVRSAIHRCSGEPSCEARKK